MSSYGWQVFRPDGSLAYDNSVVMSRRLGFYDIPLMEKDFSHTIGGIPFRDGTPFTHVEPLTGWQMPPGQYGIWMPIIPGVDIGPDWVRIYYTGDMYAYLMDDFGRGNFYGGMMRVHWGVYNK